MPPPHTELVSGPGVLTRLSDTAVSSSKLTLASVAAADSSVYRYTVTTETCTIQPAGWRYSRTPPSPPDTVWGGRCWTAPSPPTLLGRQPPRHLDA